MNAAWHSPGRVRRKTSPAAARQPVILVREKCAGPNKFGLPETETLYIGKLIS